MIEIPLTQGKVALIDDDMYDRVSRFNWIAHKNGRMYYAESAFQVNLKFVTLSMHRLVMGYPDGNIDHINHDGLDNRRENLRVCTVAQNGMNRQKNVNGSSKYRGVRYVGKVNRWRANIKLNGKKINVGSFLTEIEAALAWNKKALELFGEFANLNVIEHAGV